MSHRITYQCRGCPATALPGSTTLTPKVSPSEDCLFLNVWTKPQVGEKKKAVLVWIFGGGFSMGDSADPLYNGAKLAQNQDVVVVVSTSFLCIA
jgi:carboxylesterase type B